MSGQRNPGSFRDPDGFVYTRDGILLRQIHLSYQRDWQQLHESGLYRTLVEAGLLVEHVERPLSDRYDANAWRVIAPEPVPWISYPYEWTPKQLRAAAVLTLDVLERALDCGMTLKDAAATNVQFIGSRPVFIDTLSFTVREEASPWAGYRQFCQHFVGPLALMERVDPRLRDLSRSALDGPALDLVSGLLPRSSWASLGLLTHVHLHARTIAGQGGRAVSPAVTRRGVSLDGAKGLLGHLRSTVERTARGSRYSEWSDYEATHNYSDVAMATKREVVGRLAAECRPALTFDLGANTGQFSQLVAEHGGYVVAFDADLGAVECCWDRQAATDGTSILPIWSDLTNPSPAQGWGHAERASLAGRGPADLVLALALVHHLAIQHNVPLPAISQFLARLGRRVLLEWVPKDDPQAQRLLVTRPDIFIGYHEPGLLAALEPDWHIDARHEVPGTGRQLYALSRR